MRAVVQRVKGARVTVEGEETGAIEEGILVYLGICKDDTTKDLDYLADKVVGLRIFRDQTGNMNRSVKDAGGGALLVSQFTLYGDVRRGKRPSFTEAMAPEEATEVFDEFVQKMKNQGIPCETGIFGAMMDVESVNDGPVTILLDSKKTF